MHYQHLHSDQEGRLCCFPETEELGSLAWLCSCQLYAFSQEALRLGLPLLPPESGRGNTSALAADRPMQ